MAVNLLAFFAKRGIHFQEVEILPNGYRVVVDDEATAAKVQAIWRKTLETAQLVVEVRPPAVRPKPPRLGLWARVKAKVKKWLS